MLCKSYANLIHGLHIFPVPVIFLFFPLSLGCSPWEIQTETGELWSPPWLGALDGALARVELTNLRQVSDRYLGHRFRSERAPAMAAITIQMSRRICIRIVLKCQFKGPESSYRQTFATLLFLKSQHPHTTNYLLDGLTGQKRLLQLNPIPLKWGL